MLFKNSVRTSKRTPHFTITKINWLTLFKFKHVSNMQWDAAINHHVVVNFPYEVLYPEDGGSAFITYMTTRHNPPRSPPSRSIAAQICAGHSFIFTLNIDK
jgi:hypothetical protein